MSKVVVFLADGFEECEALIVVDILRRAGIETEMASVMGRREVLSSRKIEVKADVLLEDVAFGQVDMVFLPGGRLGVENLERSEKVKSSCELFAREKKLAAICAAPSILAHLGLLSGKKATCHPDFEGEMGDAVLTHEHVAVDGNIYTGQGLGATFELAFVLAEVLTGSEKVERIRKAICYR